MRLKTGLIAFLFLPLLMFAIQASAKGKMHDLPSWVEVSFTADDVYDKKKNYVKDDVIGFLIADGLKPESLHWYKPLFGNQNMLVFEADKTYIDKLTADIVKNIPMSIPPWSVAMGEVTPAKATWKRMHYGPVHEVFKIDMYWCNRDKKRDQIVVFWGTDYKQFFPQLKKLMVDLSPQCK